MATLGKRLGTENAPANAGNPPDALSEYLQAFVAQSSDAVGAIRDTLMSPINAARSITMQDADAAARDLMSTIISALPQKTAEVPPPETPMQATVNQTQPLPPQISTGTIRYADLPTYFGDSDLRKMVEVATTRGSDKIDFTKAIRAVDILPGEGVSRVVPSATPIVNTAPAIKTESGVSPRAQHMLESFQSAFPNKKFEVTEKNGVISLSEKVTGATEPLKPVATTLNTSSDTPMTGLKDMQVALEKATTDDERLKIAFSMKTMVAQMQAQRQIEYQRRAELELNIPMLAGMVDASLRADAVSPHNPRDGTVSKQTQEALTTLASARMLAAQRVESLVKEDPMLRPAMALADNTIEQIKASSGLANRDYILSEKKAREEERNLAIQTAIGDPNFDRIAIMVGANISTPEARIAFANKMATGKVQLSAEQKQLATADPQTLAMIYPLEKNPQKQMMILSQLQHLEAKRTGNPEAAAASVRAFQKVMQTSLESPEAERLSPGIRKAWESANIRFKDSPQDLARLDAELHQKMAKDVALGSFRADVRSWTGQIKADAIAQAVIKNADPSKPMDIRTFISNYLAANIEDTKANKLQRLRFIVKSAADALPDSLLFPKPDPYSVQAEVDKLTASMLSNMALPASAMAGSPLWPLAAAGQAIGQMMGGNK